MYRNVFSKMLLVVLLGVLIAALPAEISAKRKVIVKPPRRPPVKVVKLPPAHKKITVGGVHYFHHHGVFYKKGPKGYVVVRAPIGARLNVLPEGFVTVHVGKVPYYRYYGTYYVYDPDEKVYVVSELPEEAEISDEPTLDKMVLIDGTTLEGVYMGGTKSIVQFEVEGETRDIPVEEIVSIHYAPATESDE
jgi:hypothetical protein